MRFRIEFTPRAAKEFAALTKGLQRQIARRVDALAEDPTPEGSRLIDPKRKRYRIRSGDYRVLHEVRRAVLIVLVVRVGHRRDVSRNMPR